MPPSAGKSVKHGVASPEYAERAIASAESEATDATIAAPITSKRPGWSAAHVRGTRDRQPIGLAPRSTR